MKNRILIVLEGGLVKSVITNIKDLEYTVIDYDLPETELLKDIDVYPSEADCYVKTDSFSSNDEVFGDPDTLTAEESHFVNCLKQQGW